MAPSLIAAIVLGMWLSTTNPSASAATTASVLTWWTAETLSLLTIHRLAGLGIASLAPAEPARARRLLHQATRISTLTTFLAFGWLLLGAGWLEFVRRRTATIGSSLVEEFAILAPFLLFEALGWWGLQPGEQAVEGLGRGRLARNGLDLLGRARRRWGLLLPVLAFLLMTQDLVNAFRPEWSVDATAQAALMTILGLIVATFAPHLLRLAWTTRPLPPGPLRDRLETIARRHGLRFREILLWDTGHRMVNAVVTGILPWSRYVLLSDALVACLDEAEIEAIFGHEVGHVAHRHLVFLGFFAVATLAVVAINGAWLASAWTWALPDGLLGEAIHGLIVAALLGGFLLAAFGYLSRRLERQADLFGCRTASGSIGDAAPLDVSTFVRALHQTAAYNGIDPGRPSWRHGSIHERVAFLTRLAADPRAERAFQLRIRWIQIVVASLLLAALAGSLLATLGQPSQEFPTGFRFPGIPNPGILSDRNGAAPGRRRIGPGIEWRG